jgi:photosystem II stability/assembly factor-like uncharacterized protein
MRKKLIYIFFILGFLSGNCLTKAQWLLDYQFQLLNYQNLQTFSVPDTNNMWVILSDSTGYGHYINKRINNQWTNINTSGLDRIRDIIAIDSSKTFVSNNGKQLYYTSNSGLNWLLKLAIDTSDYLFYYIPKSSPGCIYSASLAFFSGTNRIHKSTNNGTNWITQSFSLEHENFFQTIFATDSNHIWIGINCFDSCSDLKYMYSTSGGSNWLTKILPQVSNNTDLIAPHMKSNNQFGLMLSFGYYTYIYRTTDGGGNWSSPQYFFGDPEYFTDMKNVDSSSVWYCTTTKHILKSTDDGISWNPMTAPIPDTDSFSQLGVIRTGNKIDAWTITYLGRLLKLIDYVIPIGINPISTEIPKTYSLSQNYPNPFNPATNIRFSLPNPSEGGAMNTKLIVYDALGREVATLINEQLKPGSYEVEWDASNYPSGVYFYRLATEVYSQTRKMILIK